MVGLVLDAGEGVTQQDFRLAKYIVSCYVEISQLSQWFIFSVLHCKLGNLWVLVGGADWLQ